ncbi:histidine kinase [Clostridium sp. CTA-19]
MKKINDYNIYIKILALIFIVTKSIQGKIPALYVVAYFLLCLIINFSVHLFKDNIEKLLLVSGIIISFIISITVMPLAIIFFFINLIEFLYLIKLPNAFLLILIWSIVVFLKIDIDFFSLFIFIAIYFIYYRVYWELNFINYDLPLKIEMQRKTIDELNLKLKKQSKYRKQAIYTYKLKERNELSKKVHDKVGHTIAGSLLQLEACKIVLNSDMDKGKEMIDGTIGVLRRGMDDIRKILREINPTDEQIGINRIKLILNEKTQNTNFTFNVIHKGDMEKISKKQWMLFLDVIMESSTNSLKYSEGNHITVKIEVFNKLIKLQIADDGIGNLKFKKGIGLNSIEQEAMELNGKCIINSYKGFEIILLMPIETIVS